jgi:hypothetical protein
MTLAEMTAQFVALMNRSDLRANTALATTFITQAILRIQRELRVPMMEATILYEIPADYDASLGLAIPNDMLQLIGLHVGEDQEYELQRAQFSTVKQLAKEGPALPRKFARLGGSFVLGPAPGVGDTIMIRYYASFPALTLPGDTNALSIIAWDAPVYGALAAACDYYNDDRVGNFEKRYNQILQNLQNMADGDELTADAAVSTTYAWPDDGI